MSSLHADLNLHKPTNQLRFGVLVFVDDDAQTVGRIYNERCVVYMFCRPSRVLRTQNMFSIMGIRRRIVKLALRRASLFFRLFIMQMGQTPDMLLPVYWGR